MNTSIISQQESVQEQQQPKEAQAPPMLAAPAVAAPPAEPTVVKVKMSTEEATAMKLKAAAAAAAAASAKAAGYTSVVKKLMLPNGGTIISYSKRAQVKTACVGCRKSCKKCDNVRPCTRCTRYGLECVDAQKKERKPGGGVGKKLKASPLPTLATNAETSSSTSLTSTNSNANSPNHEGVMMDVTTSFGSEDTTRSRFTSVSSLLAEEISLATSSSSSSTIQENGNGTTAIGNFNGDENPSLQLLSEICGLASTSSPSASSSTSISHTTMQMDKEIESGVVSKFPPYHPDNLSFSSSSVLTNYDNATFKLAPILNSVPTLPPNTTPQDLLFQDSFRH